MGRALVGEPANVMREAAGFADLYERWQALVDLAPSPLEGETPQQFEARADVLGACFQAVETAILRSDPADVGEMIAMLEVVRRDDALGADQVCALASLQRALGSWGLKSAFTPSAPAWRSAQL